MENFLVKIIPILSDTVSFTLPLCTFSSLSCSFETINIESEYGLPLHGLLQAKYYFTIQQEKSHNCCMHSWPTTDIQYKHAGDVV